MTNEKHNEDLRKLLNEMTDTELQKYLTLLVLIDFVCVSDEGIHKITDINPISAFIYPLFINIILDFNDDNDLLIDVNNSHYYTRNVALVTTKSHTIIPMFNSYNSFLDSIYPDSDIEMVKCLGIPPERDRIMFFAIFIANDIASDLDYHIMLLEFITRFNPVTIGDIILGTRLKASKFYDNFNRILCDLHKGDHNPRISVWADLFEKMLYNNFKLEQNEIKAILTLQEKDLRGTIAESSEILYSYLYGGFSDKYEMRLIILGEKGHGKTAFRSRFVDLEGRFPEKEDTTEGVDFETYLIPGSEKKVTIKFWDFAGDSVTHEAHKYFLTERAVYVIVYGSRQEEQGQISKWLEHIRDFAEIDEGKKPKVFILINFFRDTNGKNVPVTINEN
jgi:hypothetical protein